MEKSKFKKMALMGMAGGMLIATQSPVSAEANSGSGTYLAGGACGGKGGCGGSRSAGGAPQGWHSCGSSSSSNPYTNSPQNDRYYTSDSQDSYSPSSQGTYQQKSTTTTTMGTRTNTMMSESEFMSQLNADGKALYQSLSPEGKALALRNSQNFQDKNEAVKAAARQMTEKRTNMTSPGSMTNTPNKPMGR